MTAEPRFVDRDGVRLAYQVTGDGPPLLFVNGWFTDLVAQWEVPSMAAFLQRLGSGASVISVDKRGIGRSSRVAGWPDIDTKVEDLGAVLDALDIDRLPVVGTSESGPLAAAFAAAHPDRVSSLVLHATRARYGAPVDGYPFGYGADELEPYIEWYEQGWGTEGFAREFLEWAAPSVAGDPTEAETYAALMRASGEPATVADAVRRTYAATDIRDRLGAIRCPTLVIARRDDQVSYLPDVRWLAEHIDGATLVELDGADHAIWSGDTDDIVNRIGAFTR